MKEKTMINLGITIARGLVDALENELVSKKKKKEKKVNGREMKVRSLDKSGSNRS